jgi:capsular polysaccharide biosynthesis protein
MFHKFMTHLFSYYFRTILIWGILMMLLFTGVSLLFPRQYSAESTVLLISRDRSGVDPYTQAKSAERIGQDLAQIMPRADFYNKVITSTAEFNRAVWQKLPERDRRKKWAKDVTGSVVYGTSLFTIKVYSTTQQDAVALSDAVTQTFMEQSSDYAGGNVVVRELDSGLVSTLPARPNFIINAGIGFWVGVVVSGLWVLRYKKHKGFI